jgi:hypothetical protein
VVSGIGGIVTECYRNRALRAPIRHDVLMAYLRLRQSEADPVADTGPAVFRGESVNAGD